MNTGLTGEYNISVQSVGERRFAGVIRQQYDFSCGSAALATLLTFHYGDARDEQEVFRGMWRDGDRAQIRRAGFSLLDMKRYLAARGKRADGFKVTLDRIAQTGIPGIALITVEGYRHFVVVKGVRGDEVLVGDPSLGLRVMPRDRFQAAWNGIYFAINEDVAEGRSRFNRDSQWASYTRAPGARFRDPLDLQSLYLTAPSLTDF